MVGSPLRGRQRAGPSHRTGSGLPSGAQPGPQYRSGRNRRESGERAQNVRQGSAPGLPVAAEAHQRVAGSHRRCFRQQRDTRARG